MEFSRPRSEAILPALIVAMACIVGAVPAEAQFRPIAAPADQGVVYIYRHRAFVGGGIRPRIGVDDSVVGELSNGRYLAIALPPGPHILSVVPLRRLSVRMDPQAVPIQLNIEAGHSTYVRVTIGPHAFSIDGIPLAWATTFELVGESHALIELPELRAADAARP